MDFKIREIISPDERGAICNKILRSLPDWFGIEASIVDYAEDTRSMPFYAAFAGDETDAVGFLAIKEHNEHTAEICVMGILSEYHRTGIGRELTERAVRRCAAAGKTFLTVKTLDESANSDDYARTRKFYYAMGFIPLEVFPLLWDESNPCLFLAKYLGDRKKI